MNDEFHDLEASLASLRPALPDAAFLARLESAAQGSLVIPTVEETRLEHSLSGHRPVALPADFFASLEKIVANTPFQVDEKIVLFTKGNAAAGQARRFRPMLAAAAVALMGAVTALMVPGGSTGAATGKGAVASTAPARPLNPNVDAVNFSPAGYGRNVQEAKDEGIVWSDNRPFRRVRVVYKEIGSFINAEGKRIEVETPRTEYILVPEKMD